MTQPEALRGCIPILCTPFADDGSVDLESLRGEIDWVIAEGATGVATLALASEGYKLTERERELIAATVVEHAAGRVPVVVSADGPGTAVAVGRAVQAEEIGASALMVLPPYLVKPDSSSLYDYYRQIGESVRIPIMIQDAPQLTGVPMGPALWARIAEDVPTVQYVKVEGTPQGATISDAIQLSEGKLRVFCGWGGLGVIDALERGAVGSMPAANFTRMFAEIHRRYDVGDLDGAAAVFEGGLPFALWAMQSLDYSVAAAKHELKARGVFTAAFQRQPRTELDATSQRQLQSWIDARIVDTSR